MAPRFYSKEWIDAVKEKTNNDKEYLKKATKLTASFLYVVTDCPDGNDLKILFKFDKGKITEYEVKPAPAGFRIENEAWDPSKSIVRAQGSYDTYKKLQTKEMNPMQALSSGQYTTDGNMAKALTLMPYLQSYTDLQATVACEY